jgi:hypothetical protein
MIFLLGSISKIAKQATGAVSGFKKVLELSPGALPFVMPPQIQMGLLAAQKASGLINSLTGSSLKVPTAADLQKLATGEVDLILKGIRRPVLDQLAKARKDVLKSAEDVTEALNRIDWLL